MLAAPRLRHTATLLPNGTVLAAGGGSVYSPLASAETYDPVTGAFSATGSLLNARTGHTATLLPSGKVLVQGNTGLLDPPIASVTRLRSAELYDPATRTFSFTGGTESVTRGILVVLPNGTVMLVGDSCTTPCLNPTEIYHP